MKHVSQYLKAGTWLPVHWVYMAPALIFLAVMSLFPLLHTLWLSLYRFNLSRPWVPRRFVGLDNFGALFSDPILLNALSITMMFAAATLILQLVLGLCGALLLQRDIPGKTMFRAIFVSPMMVAPVIAGLIWRLMLNDSYGMVNWILKQSGASPVLWLGNDWALWSVVLAETWQWLPFSILLFGVGLTAIPKTYYEAADVDGASAGYVFRRITLPNLRWVIFLIAIFKLSDAVKAFDTIYIMTGGGPGIATQTVALYIQKTGFSHFEMGYAAALSLLLLGGTLAIIWPFIRRDDGRLT